MENYLKDKQIIISMEEYNFLKETEKEYNSIFLNAKKDSKNIVIEEVESLFILNSFFKWNSPSPPKSITIKRPQVITGEENIRKYFLEKFNENSKYIEKYEYLKATFNEEIAIASRNREEKIKSKYWLIRKIKF